MASCVWDSDGMKVFLSYVFLIVEDSYDRIIVL
jgi:hypothetical protein